MRDTEDLLLTMNDTPLTELPVVVLDTETTGLYPGLGDRVVELAAVRYERWQPVATINRLVQPGRAMDPVATRISGITDAELADKPPFAAIAAELLDLLDGALLVAHNAAFDAEFTGMELWLAGYFRQDAPREPILSNPWLCTLQLARGYFYFDRNNLGFVARRLGVRTGRAHRALSDVYTTAAVLKRMTRELADTDIVTAGDWLHAQGGPIFSGAPPAIAVPAPIDEAIVEGRRLRIFYVDEEQSNREITPRYAVHHRGVPHLIAYSHDDHAQRPFRLDRIFSAELI